MPKATEWMVLPGGSAVPSERLEIWEAYVAERWEHPERRRVLVAVLADALFHGGRLTMPLHELIDDFFHHPLESATYWRADGWWLYPAFCAYMQALNAQWAVAAQLRRAVLTLAPLGAAPRLDRACLGRVCVSLGERATELALELGIGPASAAWLRGLSAAGMVEEPLDDLERLLRELAEDEE